MACPRSVWTGNKAEAFYKLIFLTCILLDKRLFLFLLFGWRPFAMSRVSSTNMAVFPLTFGPNDFLGLRLVMPTPPQTPLQ